MDGVAWGTGESAREKLGGIKWKPITFLTCLYIHEIPEPSGRQAYLPCFEWNENVLKVSFVEGWRNELNPWKQ